MYEKNVELHINDLKHFHSCFYETILIAVTFILPEKKQNLLNLRKTHIICVSGTKRKAGTGLYGQKATVIVITGPTSIQKY